MCNKQLMMFSLIAGVLFSLTACGSDGDVVMEKPKVAGHRGAAALRPEHTLASYQQAIDDGADIIEPDLVPTKDGQLVARHESFINETTNVADHPEFASRRQKKTIDGVVYDGWFTEDFTLAELKTLRAWERIPATRPGNVAYNDKFEIPTLDEVIKVAEAHYLKSGKVVGLYPETKHPTYFKSIGLALEDRLIDALAKNAYTANTAYVYIQSFEVANLKQIRKRLSEKNEVKNARIVQLFDYKNADGSYKQPWDFVVAKDPRTYRDLLSPSALIEARQQYADVVAPYKEWLIPRTADNKIGQVTTVIADAHAAGLKVHTWTFRPENTFLPSDMRTAGGQAEARNDAGSISEIQIYLAAGLDGFFTDDSRIGRQAVDTLKR